MSEHEREAQVAAVGVTVAALLEVLVPARGEGTGERVGHCLAAGVLALVYAQLVPEGSWGARSGAAFGQLPVVGLTHARLGAAPPLKLALWGALTGLGLSWLPRRRWRRFIAV